ncbi:hypothetical protein BJV77DRAFT_20574 [Russula vinacea]|nr:hypothetical protein BJV77DRAFT_20574 [Russula vinacea]
MEVHSEEEYEQHVRPFRGREWPGGLLRFSVFDNETPRETPNDVSSELDGEDVLMADSHGLEGGRRPHAGMNTVMVITMVITDLTTDIPTDLPTGPTDIPTGTTSIVEVTSPVVSSSLSICGPTTASVPTSIPATATATTTTGLPAFLPRAVTASAALSPPKPHGCATSAASVSSCCAFGTSAS